MEKQRPHKSREPDHRLLGLGSLICAPATFSMSSVSPAGMSWIIVQGRTTPLALCAEEIPHVAHAWTRVRGDVLNIIPGDVLSEAREAAALLSLCAAELLRLAHVGTPC